MQKRGICFVLVAMLIIFSSLVFALEQENIVYSNDDIKFYYGLAVFKNNEEGDGINRITHQFLTPDHFDTETAHDLYSYLIKPPINALVAVNEQWFTYMDLGNDLRFISFEINKEDITLTVKGDASEVDEEGECTWELKLNDKGCYIFVEEVDIDRGAQDDCAAGMFKEGSVIEQSARPLSEALISDDANGDNPDGESNITGTYYTVVDNLIPAAESADNFDDVKNYIFNTDSVNTESDLSLICAPKKFEFRKDGNAKTEYRYVWMSCNAQSVGKYISVNLDYENEELNPDLEEKLQCSLSNGNYIWLQTEAQTCADIDCDLNKDVCVNNEKYNWNDEGFCCGDDELNDLGLTTPDKKYICLKNDPDVVGYSTTDVAVSERSYFKPGKWEELSPEPQDPTTESICGTDWCWVPSESDQYNIYTIKKPGKEPVDVVSTVDEWLFCDESGPLKFTPDFLTEATKLNRFYISFQ